MTFYAGSMEGAGAIRVIRAPPKLPEHKRQVAVKLHDVLPVICSQVPTVLGMPAALITLDLSLELHKSVEEILCDVQTRSWRLPPATAETEDACSYALMFESGLFVTEQRKTDVKNGGILLLTLSLPKTAGVLYNYLNQSEDILFSTDVARGGIGDAKRSTAEVLDVLLPYLNDVEFVHQFIQMGGLQLLSQRLVQRPDAPSTSKLLECFVRMMEHSGLAEWSSLDRALVECVCSHVNGTAKHENIPTIIHSLILLEMCFSGSTTFSAQIRSAVPIESLVRHLNNSHVTVQHNTLALINALFSRAQDATERAVIAKLLSGNPVRHALMNNVLQRTPIERLPGTDLAQQLAIMQRLILNVLYERALLCLSDVQPTCHSPINIPESNTISSISSIQSTTSASSGGSPSHPLPDGDLLTQLRLLCFPSTSQESARSPATSPALGRRHKDKSTENWSHQFEILGFEEYSRSPQCAFDSRPPGVLALDCMIHFVRERSWFASWLAEQHSARQHTDEDACYLLPFARASRMLTNMLISTFGMGEPPDDTCVFYSLLASSEHSFAGVFSAALMQMYTLADEMRATAHDMDKVLAVLQEQVRRALSTRHTHVKQFAEQLAMLTYAQIKSSWAHQQFEKDQKELRKPAIQRLADDLRPTFVDLVARNRIPDLKRGRIFQKLARGDKATREKGKFWFWRLGTNEKALFYAECEETSEPSVRDDDAWQRVALTEIDRVLMGLECLAEKERKSRKAGSCYAFALLMNTGEPRYNFVAVDEATFDLWTDGLSMLCGGQLHSRQSSSEVSSLLSMELRMRMLELDSAHLPDDAPPIPDSIPPPFDL